jgi:hypothetical protein
MTLFVRIKRFIMDNNNQRMTLHPYVGRLTLLLWSADDLYVYLLIYERENLLYSLHVPYTLS